MLCSLYPGVKVTKEHGSVFAVLCCVSHTFPSSKLSKTKTKTRKNKK